MDTDKTIEGVKTVIAILTVTSLFAMGVFLYWLMVSLQDVTAVLQSTARDVNGAYGKKN